MRPIHAILLSLSVLASVAGCAGADASDDPSPVQPEDHAEKAPNVAVDDNIHPEVTAKQMCYRNCMAGTNSTAMSDFCFCACGFLCER